MSNPTQVGTLLKDDNGEVTNIFKYTNITTATTTLVKTGAGFLHNIVVNNGSISSIEIDDALTQTTPHIGTTANVTLPFTLSYDIAFSTGLCITTVGTTNITVSWR